MKKILTVVVLILSFHIANGQTWFDVGIKGGVGTSFMYNRQVFDNQEVLHQFKPGYTFGAKLGFNFIQEHQITFDVMNSSFSQGFSYGIQGIQKHRNFTIKGFDLLLMYRANRGGTYFEIGPQWSNTSSVKYTDEGGDYVSPIKPEDIIDKTHFGIAFGFGGYVFGTDNFGITTGLRFNYTFNDIATQTGNQINFPIFQSVEESDPTHNLGIMFIVEANYDFGYLVSSSCGQRKKLFKF